MAKKPALLRAEHSIIGKIEDALEKEPTVKITVVVNQEHYEKIKKKYKNVTRIINTLLADLVEKLNL